MGYLVCENCGKCFEEGKSPDYPQNNPDYGISHSFSDICECGSKMDHYDYIPLNKAYKKCSACGYVSEKGITLQPLSCSCVNCFRTKVVVKDKCPICGFKGELIEKVPYKAFVGAIYACRECENVFGIIQKTESQGITNWIQIAVIGGIIIIFLLVTYQILFKS